MILKKIRLNNIRSYNSQEIVFPEGNLLLAGNIGSGKSTVLLSVDFVLFGLRKGSLSGGSLLRSGSNEGSVELFLNIGDKEVVLMRSLKRSSTGISQNSGYIIIDGEKRDLSALELKQAVLDLLNYPAELLTKSKDMIFHYTVYTPQEDMKTILLGDKEIRLNTLRKIFGMDKYKIVKENTKIFLSNLRERINILRGKIERLDEKQSEKNNYEIKKQEIDSKITELANELETKKRTFEEKSKKIKELESQLNELNDIKRELSVIDTDLTNKNLNLEKSKKELEDVEEKINSIKVEDVEQGDLRNKIRESKERIENAEKSLRLISDKISVATVTEENSRKIVNSIQKLASCPTCKQEVGEEHKKKIISEENKKILESKDVKEKYLLEQKSLERDILRFKEELETLREKEKQIEINELKKKELNSYGLRRRVVEREIKDLVEVIESLKNKRERFVKKSEEYKQIDIGSEKQELDILQSSLREFELRLNGLDVERKNIESLIYSLEREITEMIQIKKRVDYLSQLREWLTGYFINVVDIIERNVMFRIHSDFNSLFQKWFDMLIDNENLKINLDKEFSPLITQGGHDLDYLYLSGGEKNAAALAYRLALNQVINNLITEIKTRDLLILDEPTDGFSEEQLDRMRLVLEELNIKQIILVSHEAKIESFVDNVVRFNKENNVSSVLN